MTLKSRRSILKELGFTALSLPLIPSLITANDRVQKIIPQKLDDTKYDSPLTAITLGAGARGNTYGNFANSYPKQLKIVGVAEPISIRNERYAQKHTIEEKHRFTTWEHVFEKPKFADAIIITTPDDLHYGPCMAALKMGYDILLEKPISPSEEQCREILELSIKTKRIVAVCHVLRYAPYFKKMKEIVASGVLGQLMSINHFEPIQHIHMAHSFVRGNWHNSKETTPIILAKSCHDMDIMRWLIGTSCEKIAAFGDLGWFKASNAPEGSTDRCTDGCSAEETCPYSALKVYHRDRSWTYVFDFPEDESTHGDFILDQLKTTDYGRCVYKMDNDQADHYVASMQFKGGITANFSMEAFTSYHGRKTRIMGAMGDIVGDMNQFVHTDFLTKEQYKWDVTVDEVSNYKNSGHGGGDWALVSDWIKAIKNRDPSILSSTIDASVESHLMAFAAEKSRASGNIIEIKV